MTRLPLLPTQYVIGVGNYTYQFTRRRQDAQELNDKWMVHRCETDMRWHSLHVEHLTTKGEWVRNINHDGPIAYLTLDAAEAIVHDFIIAATAG